MNAGGNNTPSNSVPRPEAAAPTNAPPANRGLALSEKVRSLRLNDKLGQGGGAPGGLVWALLILVLLLGGVMGYNAYATNTALKKIETLEKKAAELEEKEEGYDEGIVTVGGSGPEPAKEEIALQYKGYIVPMATILVSPQVGGKVLKLNFKEGQNVKAGDFLAEIEAIEFQADFDKAQAAVRGAAARLNVLKKYRGPEIEQVATKLADLTAQEEQVRLEFRRIEALHVRNASTRQELEESRARFESIVSRKKEAKLALDLMVEGPRDEQIEAARADLDGAIAESAKAKWRLGNTTINAPVSGTILTKKAEENNQVNPAAFSNGLSASLCEMADLTELEVDVAVVERDRSRVKENMECRIRVDAWPGKVYQGYVSRIMPTADRGKNAIPVRVRVSKKQLDEDRGRGGPFLLPEMSASVTFLNREADPKAFEK